MKISKTVLTLAVGVTLMAVPAVATAATPLKSTVKLSSLSEKTVTTGDSDYLTGSIKPADFENKRTFQIQVKSTHSGWKSLGSHSAYGSIINTFKAPKPGTYSVRLFAPRTAIYAQAISNVKTLIVEPKYPVVKQNGNSLDVRLDSQTEETVAVGSALYDSQVTNCYGPDPNECASPDVPKNGSYISFPITITMVKGTDDYNVLNYAIKTPDGQVFNTTFEDTKHGQALNSGTLTAPDLVSGEAVFDAPIAGGSRLSVEHFGTFVGYIYF